jgi:raffinose/stachyose/melibiose transport system substrate-binding protein
VDQGSVEDVVKAFEAANPGVKVNFSTSGADQYQQQIRTQLSSGTAPRRDVGVAGQRQPGCHLCAGQAGYLRDLFRPGVGRQAAGRGQERRAVRGQDLQRVFGLNGIGAVYNQQP